MIKRISFFFGIIMTMMLLGCGGGETVEVKAEGGTPEFAATKFFYSIYNTRDMDEVVKYTTPKLSRIVKGYGSIQGVARNMLNMQFDEVVIEIDKGRNLRETYGDTATISLIFTGTHLGNKVTDTRTVNMVREKGEWLVEKVKHDPFAR